jgi:hypothetical protein
MLPRQKILILLSLGNKWGARDLGRFFAVQYGKHWPPNGTVPVLCVPRDAQIQTHFVKFVLLLDLEKK